MVSAVHSIGRNANAARKSSGPPTPKDGEFPRALERARGKTEHKPESIRTSVERATTNLVNQVQQLDRETQRIQSKLSQSDQKLFALQLTAQRVGFTMEVMSKSADAAGSIFKKATQLGGA